MLPAYEGIVQKGQIRLPTGTSLPDGARVYVMVVPALDERSARRQANRWLGENVGNMVLADQPVLLTLPSRNKVWRFGAFVTSLSHEPFGPIGYVDIDAETGDILANAQLAEEMAQRGERLERAPLPTAG
ncbi:MAG: hypothetical protein JW850_04380 [Thermoflexales bacterium]|nr:hypothetical protein [Thermoflexales bacterium]